MLLAGIQAENFTGPTQNIRGDRGIIASAIRWFDGLLVAQNLEMLPAFMPFGFLCCDLLGSILDGDHAIWLGLAKSFAIKLFDENRQRSFPTFLLVIVQ
jgi:hypothetical protein